MNMNKKSNWKMNTRSRMYQFLLFSVRRKKNRYAAFLGWTMRSRLTVRA